MKYKKLFYILIILGGGIIFGPRVYTTITTQRQILALDDIPDQEIAIIFGAALRRDGLPSAALRVRVVAAVDLYLAGIVNTLIMSGAEPEPLAMKELAIEMGVDEADILLDNDGLRSYDTCASAIENFGVSEAVLVTQSFHMARTIYLCDQLGIDSVGFNATDARYWRGALVVWNIRETLATVKAIWDLYIQTPQLNF